MTPNFTGWICSNCGQRVPAGTFHTCSPQAGSQMPFYQKPKDERIVELLEEIVKLLNGIDFLIRYQ
jgi:hypothetical protein